MPNTTTAVTDAGEVDDGATAAEAVMEVVMEEDILTTPTIITHTMDELDGSEINFWKCQYFFQTVPYHFTTHIYAL